MSPKAAVAVAMGAILAVILRIRGSVPAEPAPGGWIDLDDEALAGGGSTSVVDRSPGDAP